MLTLKLKYMTSEENKSLIARYQRQYTSCHHFSYNRLTDNPSISEIELRQYQSKLNNIELIKSWLYQCAIKEAKQDFKSHSGRKIVFGRRCNYVKRTNNQISNLEWKKLRLRGIYSIGEANQKGNRLFKLQPDLETIIFQPERNVKIELKLIGIGNRYNILAKLYELSTDKQIELTYKLDQNYAHISYDELPNKEKYSYVKDRVLALDLNPNYIGWSIVDWKSSSNYDIIDSGVIDFSRYDKFYSNCKLASNANKKKHIVNKHKHETILAMHDLASKAKHYKCEICTIESLNIGSKDKNKGRHFNRLTNNTWNRGLTVQMLSKLCKTNSIKIFEVKPEYSSLAGNIVFRNAGLPDMVLSSIEIGRRGYEYYNQFITKIKERKKNIVFPDKNDFHTSIVSSLEELDLRFEDHASLKQILDYINKKNPKLMYRVPLVKEKTKVFKLKSNKIWTRLISVV